MDFNETVWALTKQIPGGRVSTYGAIAKALGDVRACRAAGLALNLNPHPIVIPCHRVVYSGGRVGGFSRGVEEKVRLLRGEGVEVKDGKVVGFEKILFKDFRSDHPLKKLRTEQEELRENIVLEDSFEVVDCVGGFDVAYSRREPGLCYGACVVLDYESGEVLESVTAVVETGFPYIPTYLSYRESPVVEKLYGMLKVKPTILMLDGNGILHPRGLGLASHVGVLLDVPSVGAAKSLLCGELVGTPTGVGDAREIEYGGKTVGYGLLSSKTGSNLVYVSPGHKVSLDSSLKISRRFIGYRILEPVRRAHALAGELRKRG